MADKPMRGLTGIGSQSKTPKRIKGFSDQSAVNAVVRTLQPDPIHAIERDKVGDKRVPDWIIGKVFQRARLTGSAVNDYKAIIETQPDLKRVFSLLIDGVLSPNDATPMPIQYKINAPNFPSKEVVAALTDIVQDYFRHEHKIDGKLRKYLEKILATQGSVPLFVAPQASIDDMINPENTTISAEHLKEFLDDDYSVKPRGILGPGITFQRVDSQETTTRHKSLSVSGLGLEDFRDFCHKGNAKEASSRLGYTMTDNPGVLCVYEMGRRLREHAMASKLGRAYFNLRPSQEAEGKETTVVDTLRDKAKENGGKITEEEIYKRTFKSRRYGYTPVKSVKTLSKLDRETVGHPIWFEFSAECTVPVCEPGASQNHIGYLIAIDNSGAPLTLTEDMSGYDGLMRRQQIANSGMSNLLQATYTSMNTETDYGVSSDKSHLTIADSERMYAQVVEKDILERFKNGVVGENIILGNPTNLYKLMFYRANRGEQTRVLFVPSSMMSYLAYEFDENGVGKSLLHDVRIIAALRSILNFAHVNGEIKNSIAGAKLVIELDPEDPEPEVTVEEIVHHYQQMRSGGYIYGARPADIQHQLAMAAVDVEVSGHDGYMQTKVSTEDVSRSVNTPNEELNQRLTDMIYAGIGGIPPELVNRSTEVEFAATYIGSNAQLTKLVMNIQKPFEEGLSKFMRNFCLMSSILMGDMVEAVSRFKDKLGEDYKDMDVSEIVVELLDRLEVSLPKPKTSTTEAQKTALDGYSDFLDKILENFLSRDMLIQLEYGEKLSTNSEDVKASLKAKLMRDFIRENNMAPEVLALFDYQDEEDLALVVQQLSDYTKRLSSMLRPWAKIADKQARINDRVLAQLGEGDSSGFSDSGSSGGGDDFGGGGDGFGGDDFGMGDDFDMGGEGGDEFSESSTTEETSTGEGNTEEEPKEEGGNTTPGSFEEG